MNSEDYGSASTAEVLNILSSNQKPDKSRLGLPKSSAVAVCVPHPFFGKVFMPSMGRPRPPTEDP